MKAKNGERGQRRATDSGAEQWRADEGKGEPKIPQESKREQRRVKEQMGAKKSK